MLNAATIAAIVAAVWAHPQAIEYLDKIEQLRICAEAKGNPCCATTIYDGERLRTIKNKAWEKIMLEDNEVLELIGIYMMVKE